MRQTHILLSALICFFVAVLFSAAPHFAHSSSGRKWKKPVESLTSSDQTPPSIAARGKLRVGLEPGYMPFELVLKNGEIAGFDVDLAEEISQLMNVELELVPTTWKQLIPDLLDNKFDCIISGMEITDARKETISYVPYLPIGKTLLLNKKISSKISSYADLNHPTHKVTANSSYTEKVLKQLLPKATYVPYENAVKSTKDLLNDHLDARMDDSPYNYVVMLVYGPDKLVHLETLQDKVVLGIGINKGDPELQSWLEAFMQLIKTNGTHDRLFAKWFKDSSWISEVK